MIKRTETSSREFRAIELLAVLDSTLDRNGGYLEARLRSVPDLYRKYRVAQSALTDVVNGLYDTMPVNNLHRMQRASKQCEVAIRPISKINNSTDTTFMLDRDLLTLINCAVDGRCAVCLKSCREIKDCELRRALTNTIPLDEPEDGFICGYAKMAAKVASDECI